MNGPTKALQAYDIILRRAANGLIAGEVGDNMRIEWTVYEESAEDNDHVAAANAIAGFVHDHFPEAVWSKHHGGLDLEVHASGWTEETAS